MHRTAPLHPVLRALVGAAVTCAGVVAVAPAAHAATPGGSTFTPGVGLPEPAGAGIERTRSAEPLGRKIS